MSEAEQHRLDEVAGVQMPDDRVMTVKPGRRRVLRLSILASGAVLVLAIGSYGIAAAVTTSAPAVTSTPTVPVHNGDGPGARGFGGPRPGGFGGAGGFGAGAGSTAPAGSQIVTAIQSGSLTVAGAEGSARTVVTTTSTRYTVDGTAASASALAVGDKVTIEPVHPSDTGESNSTTAPGATATAADVNVILPELSGDVTALTSNAITLTDAQGFWRTIRTSGKTTYSQAGESGDVSEVAVGSQITAIGTVDADHVDLDATRIDVTLPSVSGKVTSVSSTSITLQPFNGMSQVVDTTPTTAFSAGGTVSSSSSVKVGAFVSATGTRQANGSLKAVKVSVYVGGTGPGLPGGRRGPRGPGRPGGLGHGWGSGATPTTAS